MKNREIEISLFNVALKTTGRGNSVSNGERQPASLIGFPGISDTALTTQIHWDAVLAARGGTPSTAALPAAAIYIRAFQAFAPGATQIRRRVATDD